MGSRFKAYDFFLLRAPRLPASIIHELNRFGSKAETWNYIRGFLKDPQFLDAIFLASDNLHERVITQADERYTPDKDKLLITLYKYINRMSGRSTPLGKFAGVSLGEIGDFSSQLQLSGKFVSSYRLDMEFVSYLYELLLKEESTHQNLIYYTNSTVYEASERYHYIDFKDRGFNRNYNWARVTKNPLLKQVLDFSKTGVKFCALAEYLLRFGVKQQDATRYIWELIDAKLLISESESLLSRCDSQHLIASLRTLDHQILSPYSLDMLGDYLLKENNCTSNKLTYTITRELAGVRKEAKTNLFQVDLRLGMSNNRISSKIVDQLSQELEELSVINNVRRPPDLESFSRKFRSRYGDREIPLLEVIDHERGIGYGSNTTCSSEQTPLLQDFGNLRRKNGQKKTRSTVQSVINRHWTINNEVITHIELDQNDLKSLGSETGEQEKDLPPGFYVLGNLLTCSNKIDDGDFRFNLLSGGGVSAVALMTRFCHLDSKLEDNLRECAEWEENRRSNCIIAEVVYLPKGRARNILTRPSFFKYEIPIVGKSNLEKRYIISLDDLMVSVNNGKIILHSKRLDKQVIPRLSSAHNFHHGMIIYRFLCDLQAEYGSLDFTWDWGELCNLPFTPRVSYKHIILCRARWKIPKISNESNYLKIISQIKTQYRIPDIVSLTEGDNELVLDLRNPTGAEIVFKQLQKRDVILHEYLYDEYNSPLKGTLAEPYNNEIIIPFKTLGEVKKEYLRPYSESKIKRSFQPGSEWTFIKTYGGSMESERLLREKIPSLIAELKKEGIINKWFFIRYSDPDQHLRIRFLLNTVNNGIPFQKLADHINLFLDPSLQSGQVYRVVYDTYEREVERYGEANMEICESIFHADSEYVLKLLPLFKHDGSHLRWLSGMLGVDHLLQAFGLNILEKITLISDLKDAFLEEFSGCDNLKYKLDIKYRENRLQIERFLLDLNKDTIHTILNNRLNDIKNLLAPLLSQINYNSMASDLLPSLSHMFINRLFFTHPREHEMVIYYLLAKHYTSIFQREKKDSCLTSII